MATTTTTIAPPIKLAALLRRSEAKKGLLFEVMLGHQVLTSRTSGSFDFVGCLVGRTRPEAPGMPGTLHVAGYFGKADALQAAVRKAERRVWHHGPLQGQGYYTELIIATVAGPADPGAQVMAATLAVFFEVGAAQNPTGWRLIRHFCDELAAAGQLEHLRRQLSDYIVYTALSGQPKFAWRAFINAGHDPMAGVWNQQNWAERRAAAEQAFIARNPA